MRNTRITKGTDYYFLVLPVSYLVGVWALSWVPM